MKTFLKYRSIGNHYREEFLRKILFDGHSSGEWVVLEKAHGANYSISYDGKDFKQGKRNGWIEENENFNGSNRVLESNKERIDWVYDVLKTANNFETITFWAEICGGKYIHPDVERDNNSKQVMKEVSYSPSNILYVFDIDMDGKYMDVDSMAETCRVHDIFHSRILFKGTMEECLEFDTNFNSKIPEWLGLPPLEDNLCEGVVIRPNDDRYLDYGEEDVRVIIKKKNDKFKEKEKQKKEKVVIEFTDEENSWMNIMAEYINENRLMNVISKIGEVGPKDFGKIMGLFKGDIMTDFCEENPDYGSLDKPVKKKIEKVIGGNLAEVVRKVLIYS